MRRLLTLCLLLTCFSTPLFAQDVKLPTPNYSGGKAVIDAIKERQSVRELVENKPIDYQTLSDLLWCAYGFNREGMRVIPTALNRQELDVYVILEDGAYLYDAKTNRLILKTSGDHRTKAGKQDYVYTAPVNLIYVVDKSKDTGTGAYISSGCAVQNVYLACASQGLACRVRGSFDKDELHKLLKLEDHQEAITTQTVGYMRNPGEPKVIGGSLPRASIAEQFPDEAKNAFFAEFREKNMDLHSLMIIKDGKVVCEQWFGENAPQKNHVMWSVSKTYTSMAVGFAVTEGLITVEDKVISYFPDDLPGEIPDNLKELKIKDLLSMSVGHEKDSTGPLLSGEDTAVSWEKRFFSHPIPHKPGTKFVYNSLATYMLSAIVQKVTGEKIVDYLKPRLFDPLGIEGAVWDSNPQGVNIGGWGLHVKTEDMAKLGLLLLQKGKWNEQQVIPEAWVEEATTRKILQNPDVDPATSESDWLQGYCYQMWRSRNGAFRADGKDGQFIIILPNENAVIAITANLANMQVELDLVWKHLLPQL